MDLVFTHVLSLSFYRCEAFRWSMSIVGDNEIGIEKRIDDLLHFLATLHKIQNHDIFRNTRLFEMDRLFSVYTKNYAFEFERVPN